MRYIICLFICSLLLSIDLFSQTNIVILPFSNLDGEYSHNQWCYELQDSLEKELKALDPEEKYYKSMPVEEINEILSDLNIDANNPLFDAEKWQAIKELEVDRVISGNFRIIAKRYLINGYIYYPETQLLDPDFQAKDIFKREDKILEAPKAIAKRLSQAFIK